MDVFYVNASTKPVRKWRNLQADIRNVSSVFIQLCWYWQPLLYVINTTEFEACLTKTPCPSLFKKQSFDHRIFQLETQKWGYCQTWSRYTVFASWLVSSSLFFARILADLQAYIQCWPLEPVWVWVNKGLLLHLIWPNFLPWYSFCCTIRKLYNDSVTSVNYICKLQNFICINW
jgi:hypothetical protein